MNPELVIRIAVDLDIANPSSDLGTAATGAFGGGFGAPSVHTSPADVAPGTAPSARARAPFRK